ncbi:ImmA/IrrE family metallo-endopeptidase [Paenibacillus sinopodophylli]|uniref:ImmA/IrrE family metallo-endopeptidase n=1 Tax=Paenibacillus sinopodophylli TaxID=1837342 RepID=UPI00110C9B12|nr:ImmA/IrrE family metallo-endopeptidase [Paenibacillus sinopodophylli]
MKKRLKGKITIKADFATAEKTARALLETLKIDSLPIELERLYDSFPNLQIKSYTWFSEIHNITIADVVEITDSESGCCWYMPEQGRYLILYNNTISNLGHIRWTIAHELGHYLLKHNERSDRTQLTRNRLSEKEYNVFEKEANCFARSLLAPSSVLVAIGKLDVVTISDICLISNEAAVNVLSFIRRGLEMGKIFKDNLIKLFNKAIHHHLYAHSCLDCQAVFSDEQCNFCPICGSEEIIKGKRYDNMIYSGHTTDLNGRVTVCGRCQNEEVGDQGSYCKICAAPVNNKCSNVDYDNNGYIEWQCDTVAAGNARYCVTCGSETLFFKNGLLKPWEDEYPRSQSNLKAVL